MERTTLNVESRTETGKGPARRLRMVGKCPAILYSKGKDNVRLSMTPREVEKHLLTEGGKNAVYDLSGGGVDGLRVLIKDYQVDPLSRALLHVDLQEISTTEKVTVTVSLNFVGKPVGVVEGGVTNIIERDIEVRALATNIPEHIDVDISALKIGHSIHLDDLTLPEGVDKVSHSNPTLVTVVPPAKEEDSAPSLTSAEPEVITEKKKDADGDKDKK